MTKNRPETMKKTGLIILSISIIISSVIFSLSNRLLKDPIGQNISLNAIHGFNGNDTPIKLSLDVDKFPTTNEFTVGYNQNLYVITKYDKKKRIFQGENIIAMFYREANLLRITYTESNQKKVKYIIEPLEWGNEE